MASQFHIHINRMKCITFIMNHKVKMITTAHNIIVKPARENLSVDFLRSREWYKNA